MGLSVQGNQASLIPQMAEQKRELSLFSGVSKLVSAEDFAQNGTTYRRLAALLAKDSNATSQDVVDMFNMKKNGAEATSIEKSKIADLLNSVIESYPDATKEDIKAIYQTCLDGSRVTKDMVEATAAKHFADKIQDNSEDLYNLGVAINNGVNGIFDVGDSGDSDSGSASGNGVGTVTIDPQDVIAAQNKVLLMRAKVQDLI